MLRNVELLTLSLFKVDSNSWCCGMICQYLDILTSMGLKCTLTAACKPDSEDSNLILLIQYSRALKNVGSSTAAWLRS